MANNQYDVIVVGGRCAGSPTAMLLARRGYRVLVVDKATFPSDTISTHLIHPPGVAALKRWGLLHRVIATGCPPIDTYVFNVADVVLEGAPGDDDAPAAYGPRRYLLDKILVDAAVEAGAEFREGFTVDELVVDDDRTGGPLVAGIRGHTHDGPTSTERARIVVGADGWHSTVARAVNPEQYREIPKLAVGYYTYWSGLPLAGRFETCTRPGRGFAALETNDDLTLVIAGWPYREFADNRKDIEGNYLGALDILPSFAARVRAAKREERLVGMVVPNFFRKPYGPGWALVGDAGYNRDFFTAQGIQDAFRSAELCATAIDEALAGTRSFDDAMRAYQVARDDMVLPMYEMTCQLARLEPPSPDITRLFAAMRDNRPAMDDFARVNSGLLPPTTFFAPENIDRILAGRREPCP